MDGDKAKEILSLVLPKIIVKKAAPKPKKYTEERRQGDRERIYKIKPWEKSTGAKTPEGKKKVSMNAYKHGKYSKAMKQVSRVVEEIKKELNNDAT